MSQEGGLDLSKREIWDLITRARSGELGQEEIDDLWDRVPQETKVEVLSGVFERQIVPHIEDIKRRAERDDAEEVRALYAQQDAETKDDLFLEALHEVVATLAEVREQPERGLLNLKELIRDPSTVEALLLILDDEEIPDWYAEEAKDYAAWYITAAGVALFPELYDEATVREVYDAFGLDPTAEVR